MCIYIYIYIYTCASVRKCTSSIISSHHPLSLCFLCFKYVCIYLCLLVGLDLMSHLHVSPKPCRQKPRVTSLLTLTNAVVSRLSTRAAACSALQMKSLAMRLPAVRHEELALVVKCVWPTHKLASLVSRPMPQWKVSQLVARMESLQLHTFPIKQSEQSLYIYIY